MEIPRGLVVAEKDLVVILVLDLINPAEETPTPALT